MRHPSVLRASRWLSIFVLLLTLLPTVNTAPVESSGPLSLPTSPRPGPPEPAWEKMDSTLALMLTAQDRAVKLAPATALGRIQADIQAQGMVPVSVRFERELTPAEVGVLEQDHGVQFHRLEGRFCHVAAIYGISVPLDRMAAFSQLPNVAQIELLNKPTARPLDVSIPLVRADQVWATQNWAGQNIRGQGGRIADLDTGVDVYHPDFWYADGGVYDWIDNDGGGFTGGGGECVDLNGNGLCDFVFPGEKLRFFEITGTAAISVSTAGVFEAHVDWLYNDVNDNAQRDYGPSAGYTETQPTYGERIFLVNDANLNNALDPGEKVIALGTSKIAATLNCGTPPVTRTRGTDLYLSDADTQGHGTGVAGVALGGNIVNVAGAYTVPNRRFIGVAPGAELLAVHTGCWPNPIPETTYIPWAANHGADVMLYEFSTWWGEFLDGSSNLEQMMDAQAANGIVQVVPAGNLAGSHKEDTEIIPAGGFHVFTANMPALTLRSWAFMAFLWRTPSVNATYTLTNPFGASVTLPATTGNNWGLTSLSGDTIWYRRLDSSRGTAKYDIWIQSGSIASGNWLVRANNPSGAALPVYAYVADNGYQFYGGMTWVNPNETKTVCHPATADSAIAVGSYATRAGFDAVSVGDLSSFSSRGARVDGARILDIAAPGGMFEVVVAESKDNGASAVGKYGWFGGTSAAGPHVAGAVALMLQKNPTLTPAQVVNFIHATAITDTWTEHSSHGGATPNDHWGWGKLNAAGAVQNTPSPADFALVVTPTQRQVAAGQATTYIVGLSPSYGFTASVTLSAGGLPAAASSSWSRNPIAPGITSTLWITTALTTPPGDHTLVITGTGGGKTHTTHPTLTVLAPALSVSKSVASSVPAGAPLSYTIHVSNAGNAAATAVVVTDAVPAGASYVECGGGTCGQSGGVITWSGLTVPAGQTVDATFVVTACAGPLVNNAYRVASCAQGVNSPWGASTTTTVQANPPTAGFTPSAPAVCVGDVVAFTNTSVNATSYRWNFGDGGTSALPNPTHAYAAPMTATVTLTASNACGYAVSQKQIRVNACLYLPLVLKGN